MSTRAVYTFIDNDGTDEVYHVYKHHDGYPAGAAEFIGKAVKYAWPLPRYEASDFAAAFVAGNKDQGGGVYLTASYKKHRDLEYRYEITAKGTELMVTAYEVHYDHAKEEFNYKEIFSGTLAEFKTKSEAL